MKKLILILNDLEGVGKTTCASVLHGYLRRKEIDHLLVSS